MSLRSFKQGSGMIRFVFLKITKVEPEQCVTSASKCHCGPEDGEIPLSEASRRLSQRR